MEGLKEAIDRVAELAVQAEKTEVVMIAGKTYANRNLVRYDTPKKAAAIHTHTLVSLLEYIEKCAGEFAGKKMTIHVESPEIQSVEENACLRLKRRYRRFVLEAGTNRRIS